MVRRVCHGTEVTRPRMIPGVVCSDWRDFGSEVLPDAIERATDGEVWSENHGAWMEDL